MDRVAIVTGASRGIGRATAIRLARDFHAVALVARTQETLAGTADAVRAAGAEPLLFARDLPGSVMTDRRKTMLQGYADTHGLPLDTAIDRFAAEVGIAHYGQPEDIANAFAFLFAPSSHWITGTALRVDGGETKVL